ncbi:MAG TPA: hypothetical protein EYH48_03185 [Aquifex aeolicus]|uniref:Roadblock/LAMTOR2 domain-containing protein n=1 Tax=Aquifex aeolicus TaxID=63363 RepID=A0A9D1CEY6_AQUAO|nr:hypothetical protein [Aquificales bacterium]HIP97826.1 hypothetical protein [Aquifex aeolicus]HIQ26322.1 hypothetical protein [Aquifex aeolicus]
MDTKFKPILEKLVRNADLEGAVLTTADGLPVESVLPAGMSDERLAAMSAAILSLGERAALELEKGSLEQITVKAQKGFVIVTGIGQEAVLTVMAPHDAKLGLLYLEIRKAAEELAKLL